MHLKWTSQSFKARLEISSPLCLLLKLWCARQGKGGYTASGGRVLLSVCLSRTPENFPRAETRQSEKPLIGFKEIGVIPTKGAESCQIHSLYFCIEERVE